MRGATKPVAHLAARAAVPVTATPLPAACAATALICKVEGTAAPICHCLTPHPTQLAATLIMVVAAAVIGIREQ